MNIIEKIKVAFNEDKGTFILVSIILFIVGYSVWDNLGYKKVNAFESQVYGKWTSIENTSRTLIIQNLRTLKFSKFEDRWHGDEMDSRTIFLQNLKRKSKKDYTEYIAYDPDSYYGENAKGCKWTIRYYWLNNQLKLWAEGGDGLDTSEGFETFIKLRR